MADIEASVTSASVSDGSGCASGVARDKLAFEGLEEFRRPGDSMAALESGAEKNAVQSCMGGRRVGLKSPVEIQHAQKSTEISCCLGRGAILEMSHSL
jgi:hypothetical protein